MTYKGKLWASLGLYALGIILFVVALTIVVGMAGFLMYMIVYVVVIVGLWFGGYALSEWVRKAYMKERNDKERN